MRSKSGVRLRASTIIRQKQVIKNVIRNHGKMGAAMLEAGYSPATAKNPQNITKSQTFQQLLDRMIPDQRSLKKLNQLLNAENIVRTYTKGDLMTENETVNTDAIARALDMIFKLKGTYAPEKHEVLMMYQDLTDQDLRKQLRELEEELGINRDPGIILEGEKAN